MPMIWLLSHFILSFPFVFVLFTLSAVAVTLNYVCDQWEQVSQRKAKAEKQIIRAFKCNEDNIRFQIGSDLREQREGGPKSLHFNANPL